ncbi:MAG: Holliday junction resolvase RuvX [Cellvibrionaceae bacterium]|nr:Holliday junction resolvase RuvX [Cellvibrionaceae bacterium]
MTLISALAFDFGSKNIGVAHGQSLTQSGEPIGVLSARDGIPDWKQILELIAEWQPKLLIVGLPFNMDGSDSELTRRARKFGNRLHARTKLAVHFVDERLSSREAKYQARQIGHNGDYRRSPVDALAACVILQSFWSQRATPAH